MTNLINTPKTMSSREIAELTGKRHGHVFRDIEKMLKELEVSQEGYVQPWIDPQNKQVYHEFLLDRRLTDCLLTGYSAKARIKVIDRWQELEKANQPQVPQTYAAALLEAGRLALENEQLQLEAKENAPKVEYYDKVLDAPNGITTTEIAAELGMSAQKLNKYLQAMSIQKKVSGRWVLCAHHLNKGYTVETTHVDDGGKSRHGMKWTEAGRKFIHEMMEG